MVINRTTAKTEDSQSQPQEDSALSLGQLMLISHWLLSAKPSFFLEEEEKTSARGQRQWLGGATHFQGVVAVLVQEGLEELSHFECQEGRQ